MGPKLSIIVPIYKVESYLPKCVDSLLNQDMPLEEYEIILVDDGSPDRCGEICEAYASRFANVKVVHRENGGLSAARNSGIEVAQGLYIQFVDSDDYLEPDVLKFLVDKMDADKLDILRFNYQNVNEKYEVFEPNRVSKPFVDYRDEVCDGLTFLTERLGFGCYAWQFMIRRELIESCRFKEGIYFEDTEWTPRILLKAHRVSSVSKMTYDYLMRDGSITKSVDEMKKQKVLQDLMLSIDYLQRMKVSVEDRRWFEGMVSQTVLSVVSYVVANCYGERKKVISQLRSKEVFPLSAFHATKPNWRKIRIANASLPLLFFIVYLKVNVI